MIVCAVRVDLHYETIKPSLLKGKSVYCEWPLASNVKAAEELDALAKENNAQTIIGLQGELSPIILKVKSLIELENKIGKVLSSSIIAAGGTRMRDRMTEGLKYFTQKVVGGNIVTIGFGHMIDFVMLVLGELSSFRSQLNIQRPQVPIVDSDGSLLEIVATDVADHIMLQGTLIKYGAPLSITFRRKTSQPNCPLSKQIRSTETFVLVLLCSSREDNAEQEKYNRWTSIHGYAWLYMVNPWRKGGDSVRTSLTHRTNVQATLESRDPPESIALIWRKTTG